MAYETAVMVNDDQWTRKYAAPIVRETAEFYRNICTKGDDGLWHLKVEPSMGQDEMGGYNQKDYLCALYSAQYCFQKAAELRLDEYGEYRVILSDGLAFHPLLSKRGYYFTCRGSGEEDFGSQKHPPQLNALAYLPVNKDVTQPERVAYDLRYEITDRAKDSYFYGWTLGEFLLAGSRIGDVEGWKLDWSNLEKSDYVDPEWIQVYETSQAHWTAFYTTTNGLIVQSLLANIISTWRAKLEIAKCLPWQEKVSFGNIRTPLGITVSGEIENNQAVIEMTAWKDAKFHIGETGYELTNGETRIVRLDLE